MKLYDSMALQESLHHLDVAFKRFFKKQAGYPHWKSRRGEHTSYHCTCVSVGDGWIRVPKIGRIKAVTHRPVEGKVKSITLSADTTGEYYALCFTKTGRRKRSRPSKSTRTKWSASISASRIW